eukprot:TRINITY_DN1029_c0_g3_i2.p2 TRINITY_DN1029_c0_g3~~TRINITY_DN1029_c0_g3_i2.p2  ORF type:complete len:182 (-),score=29.95 TRINITY_DN1029_c0_g3_i2:67-612(-)
MNTTDIVRQLTDDDSDEVRDAQEFPSVLDLEASEVEGDESEGGEGSQGNDEDEEEIEEGILHFELVACAALLGKEPSVVKIHRVVRGLPQLFARGVSLELGLAVASQRSTLWTARLRCVRQTIDDLVAAGSLPVTQRRVACVGVEGGETNAELRSAPRSTLRNRGSDSTSSGQRGRKRRRN